jgi:hypothetical protein
MQDPLQLPHILKLLDDESNVVRESVQKYLQGLGNNLEPLLDGIHPRIDAGTRRAALELASGDADLAEAGLAKMVATDTISPARWLEDNWADWLGIADKWSQLETGLGILSGFISGTLDNNGVTEALDRLALEFELSEHEQNVLGLADFLFREKGLRGVQAPSYYAPANHDIRYVIEQGEGIPISLCCIFMLVGARLGFEIEGCNLPRHFMTRVKVRDQMFLMDCFNGGRLLTETELRRTSIGATLPKNFMKEEVDAPAILQRVLRNLQIAYSFSGDIERSELMQMLVAH